MLMVFSDLKRVVHDRVDGQEIVRVGTAVKSVTRVCRKMVDMRLAIVMGERTALEEQLLIENRTSATTPQPWPLGIVSTSHANGRRRERRRYPSPYRRLWHRSHTRMVRRRVEAA